MATLEQRRKQRQNTRGIFKISDYHTCGRFKPSSKLTIGQILPEGGDSGRFFRKQIFTVGWMVGRLQLSCLK